MDLKYTISIDLQDTQEKVGVIWMDCIDRCIIGCEMQTLIAMQAQILKRSHSLQQFFYSLQSYEMYPAHLGFPNTFLHECTVANEMIVDLKHIYLCFIYTQFFFPI
jgi:hypothetical protein